ncbi:hypothetical protein [Shimia marina]|uniref:Uncharacterized protein n=1 Tax=Shimia marina TaxID=321267 RepID=A0A0P1EMB2_9RHOB|nr:hypothetical protein [Shimia marina]CUH51533.1 hypothetical protein SHM7688_00970 [Shimia marina]SFD46782.1 hypothetical protein SAMN04488037_101137 [Shimia marina]
MSQTKPVIVVSCPDVPGHGDHLCPALIASLTQAAPEHVVQETANDDTTRPEDLHVTLVMRDATDYRLIGTLEWRTQQQPPSSGPEVELTVMDSTIRPGMYRQFTDELIKANAKFVANDTN